MNKMLVAAATMAILGLTGCATVDEPEAPAVATAGPAKKKDPELITGSRIPGSRSAMVSATTASDAQKDIRDNARPYTHKD